MLGLKLGAAPGANSATYPAALERALHETCSSTAMRLTSSGFSLSSKHNCAHFPKSLLADRSEQQWEGNETTGSGAPPSASSTAPGMSLVPALGRRMEDRQPGEVSPSLGMFPALVQIY